MMIRSNSDSILGPERLLTPPDARALARFDEILRETAGAWDNADGDEIVKAIEDAFESPLSKLPPPELR